MLVQFSLLNTLKQHDVLQRLTEALWT